MGGGSYSRDSWAETKSTRSAMSTDDIYRQNRVGRIHASLDPRKINMRESRDSQDSPKSIPILIAMDGTGSMGKYADYLARTGIGEAITRIQDRKPVQYPHVAFGMIGDAIAKDQAPLQVTQFEADNRIDQIIQDFWIEKRGGGNSSESYDLPWLFASRFVSADAIEKRGEKGYIFTMGDEPAPHFKYGSGTLARVFGDDRVQGPIRTSEMLAEAQKTWRVFHIIIEQGSQGRSQRTKPTWQKLMGANALFLDDHQAMPALICATMEYAEGKELEEVLQGCGNYRASVERAFNIAAEYSPQGDTTRLGAEEEAYDDN